MKQQLLLALSSLVAGVASATPYQGDWQLLKYDAPSRWVETYFDFETESIRQSADETGFALPGEVLADLYYPEVPEVAGFELSIASDGSLSGDLTGTTSAAYERLSLSVAEDSLTLVTPLNGDIGVAIEKDVDTQSLYVAVRKSSTAPTVAGIAGDWRLLIYSLPARAIETFLNPDTSQLRFGEDLDSQAQQGEQLVDVNFSENPDRITGELNLSTSGSFSGSLTGFEGTEAVGGSWSLSGGEMTISADGDVYQLTGTASGELFVGTFADQGVRELIFLVRDGGTPTIPELAGPWRGAVFAAPLELVKTGPGLADVYFSAEYEARSLSLHLSRTGIATMGAETGTFAIAGAGIAATFEDRPYLLLPTPSGDFMVGIFAENGPESTNREIELIVLAKESRLEIEVSGPEVNVDWTGVLAVQFQRSTGLSGWSTESIAPNSRTTLPVGPAEFFRVITP